MVEHADIDYKDASHIAYLDFLQQTKDYLGEREEPYSIKELVSEYIDLDYAREARAAANPGVLFGYEDEITELKSLIGYAGLPSGETETLLEISDDAYNWTVLAIDDRNTDTGFYGCLLGTTKQDAMVAFRGSEGFKNADGSINYLNTTKDWLNADLKLLGGETVQDRNAKEFADNVVAPFLEEHPEYQEINVAGHSLGGELATTFTIHCAESNKDVYDKIGKSYNLDGPGKDESYFREHQEGIELAKEKTVLYRASLVGEMLYPVAKDENIKYVKIKNEENTSEFDRHSLKNWELDENGNIQEGNRSEFAETVGEISRTLDGSQLEAGILSAVRWIDESIITTNEYNEVIISEEGKDLIRKTAGVGSVVIINEALEDPITAGVVTFGALFVALVILGYIEVSKFQNGIEELKKYWASIKDEVYTTIGNELKLSYRNSSTYIDNFVDSIKSGVSDIASGIGNAVNPGYWASSREPYIRVDTDKLKEYADRLRKVTKKIKSVDKKMNKLYSQVSLFSWGSLAVSDLRVGTDNFLIDATAYLINTAANFEKAEKEIEKAFR